MFASGEAATRSELVLCVGYLESGEGTVPSLFFRGRQIALTVRSRILPDMILTLTHSVRLLPCIVKITSVPRTTSRAVPRPPLAINRKGANIG